LSGRPPKVVKSGDARVLAQVLGFKFKYYEVRYYNVPELELVTYLTQSEEVPESVPKNLLSYCRCINSRRVLHLRRPLSSREFTSVHASQIELIFCQLYPIDSDMENYRKDYEPDVHTRIAWAKNTMLAMAAPLESVPSSSQKSKPVPNPEVKRAEVKNTNQKAGLLVGLLVDVRSEIPGLLICASKGTSRISYFPPRKPILTLWAPPHRVLFFPDWVVRVIEPLKG